MANGIVYILINEAMEGYTKIGRTTNELEMRMQQLDTTGVPLPFECYFAKRVADEQFVEGKLHDAFKDHRVRTKREFFVVDPERVRSALELADGEDVTPRDDVVQDGDDQISLEEARKRRANFNFEMVKVSCNSELVFVKDNEVTCFVIDNKKVHFEGEETSLSAAAQKAFERLGYNWPSVPGPKYWMYEGETLAERRRRMETGD